MNDIPQLASELRDATGDIFTDAPECEAAVTDAVAAISVASERLDGVARYDAELNRLELSPNGDDYNNLIDILNGHDWRPPHTEGR